MADDNTPRTQVADTAIQGMAVLRKVRSTTDILKELTGMHYQVDKNIPGFASIVLADAMAAAVHKSANAIDTQKLTESANNLVGAMNNRQQTQETTATVNSIAVDTKEVTQKADKIKSEAVLYDTKRRSFIPQAIKKIEQGDIAQARREINEFISEGSTLIERTEKAKQETSKIQERLKNAFKAIPTVAKGAAPAAPYTPN